MKRAQVMDRTESRFIYYLKAAAIYCVVCAHVAPVPNIFGFINSMVCSRVLDCMGTMGVPIFFLISGYFYAKSKETYLSFWKKKVKTIVLPWIFCSTIVWFYVVLRKGGISLMGWFQFFLGVNNITYYLTVLMFFFFVLWKGRRYMWVMYACIAISTLGLILSGVSNPLMVKFTALTSTPYLNPIHWLGYFCTGVVVEHYTSLLEVGRFCNRMVWLAGLFLFASVGIHIYFDFPYTYFSTYAIPNTMASTVFIMGVTYAFKDKEIRWLLRMGEESYTIYLVHQLFAGGIVWLTSKADIFVLTLLRPLVTVTIVETGICILRHVNRKVNGKLGILCGLAGMREL